MEEQAKNFEDENVIVMNEAIPEKNEMPSAFASTDKNQTVSGRQKEKSSAKKEKNLKPTIDEIKSFFLQQSFPELEANKFFNYFSSVGWLIGGKIQMVDWQAAAQNWMLNAIKFKSYEKPPDRARHLNTQNDKNYAEPL